MKDYKIRCNSLHPGAILTPMLDPMPRQDEVLQQKTIKTITNNIPLRSMVTHWMWQMLCFI